MRQVRRFVFITLGYLCRIIQIILHQSPRDNISFHYLIVTDFPVSYSISESANKKRSVIVMTYPGGKEILEEDDNLGIRDSRNPIFLFAYSLVLIVEN